MGAESVQSIAEGAELVAKAQAGRLIHWFDIPPGMSTKIGVSKIGMIELTSGEEMMCTKRAQQDPIRLAFELAKSSVRYVDNDEVNSGDGSADRFWSRQSEGMAMLRQLILSAYGAIHNPETEDVASFLNSRRLAAR